ncbi:MAG TPA: hypothetical protein VGE19_14655 [Pseudoxanthomonas sp.]
MDQIMSIEAALAVADEVSPTPARAVTALKVLRAALERASADGLTEGMAVRDGYYLACFKHKSACGVLWWMPGNCGYTPDLEQAGVYFELKPGYHDSEHTVPVPVSFINRLRVRRTVDPGDSLNQMFWSAAKLREALGTTPVPEPVMEVDVDG